jgi:hypothetical protein
MLNPDPSDEYERMHPYDGTCPKHGHWDGSIDECPQCMEESMRESDAYEQQHLTNMGLCLHCKWADENQCCEAPKWNRPGKSALKNLNRDKGPKKHCKYFEEERFVEGDFPELPDPRCAKYNDACPTNCQCAFCWFECNSCLQYSKRCPKFSGVDE